LKQSEFGACFGESPAVTPSAYSPYLTAADKLYNFNFGPIFKLRGAPAFALDNGPVEFDRHPLRVEREGVHYVQ